MHIHNLPIVLRYILLLISVHQHLAYPPNNRPSAAALRLRRLSLLSVMRRVWRDGSARRVTVGSAVAAGAGATIASIRHLHPMSVLRTSASCALLSCPLFALREVVAGGLSVDGPVASVIAGGFAGYVGALAFSTGTWHAVGHGAMVAGMSAGLVDLVVSSVDYQWRSFILAKQHPHADPAAQALRLKEAEEQRDMQMDMDMEMEMDVDIDLKVPVAQVVVPDDDPVVADIIKEQDVVTAKATATVNQAPQQVQVAAADDTVSISSIAKSNISNAPTTRIDRLADLPVWMPSGGMKGKNEYENLLQSQKVTAAALRQEQDRIATLLATIEQLKTNGSPSSSNTTDSNCTTLDSSSSAPSHTHEMHSSSIRTP